MPNALNVLVGVGVIGMIPIHPLTETFGLFRDNAGEMLNAVHALSCELVHAVIFNVFLGFEAERFFDFYFNPKALRVKAVLIAAVAPVHCVVTDKDIL